MKFEVVSIFSYYYDAMMERLVQHSLVSQLDTLRGCGVLVLDYCGMSYRFIKAFRDLDARVFLVDDPNEDVSSVCLGYDAVYVLISELQDFSLPFRSIHVIFRFRNIIRMEYVPVN